MWFIKVLGIALSLMIIVTIGNAFYLTTRTVETPQAKAQRIEIERRKQVQCAADLQCTSNKSQYTLHLMCQPTIEGMAKYDFKWTDSWSESKFPRVTWVDQSQGIVGFIGDKIMFQNGFGAFRKIRYRCDVDTIHDKVVDVHVYED